MDVASSNARVADERAVESSVGKRCLQDIMGWTKELNLAFRSDGDSLLVYGNSHRLLKIEKRHLQRVVNRTNNDDFASLVGGNQQRTVELLQDPKELVGVFALDVDEGSWILHECCGGFSKLGLELGS